MKKLREEILKSGLKVTPQRLAILKLLKASKSHPTAEKVHHELVKEYPAVSLTTVYNTLATFVEAGMLRELDVDPHKMRFDSFLDPHDHFHCSVCDNVYDLNYDASALSSNLLDSGSKEGHRVDKISISLKGVCKNCTVGS